MSEDFRGFLEAEVLPYVRLNAGQILAIEAHYDLLLRWNQRLNLTARTDPREAAIRHYGESLFLGSLISGTTIADIGTGPGFPGIPIAILRPEWRITLVESDRRKAVFLREVTRSLGNIEVHTGRHETLHGEFDWVVSRAVRPDDAISAAESCSRHIGLICSEEPTTRKVNFYQSCEMPWPGSGLAMLGSVSRGT